MLISSFSQLLLPPWDAIYRAGIRGDPGTFGKSLPHPASCRIGIRGVSLLALFVCRALSFKLETSISDNYRPRNYDQNGQKMMSASGNLPFLASVAVTLLALFVRRALSFKLEPSISDNRSRRNVGYGQKIMSASSNLSFWH